VSTLKGKWKRKTPEAVVDDWKFRIIDSPVARQLICQEVKEAAESEKELRRDSKEFIHFDQLLEQKQGQN